MSLFETQPSTRVERRLPVGAEVQSAGGVHFRVWAPKRRQVTVEIRDPSGGQDNLSLLELHAEPEGYFSGFSPQAASGMRYGFRLDNDERAYPDPASRYQPAGPHGLSEIIDPAEFAWRNADWPGVQLLGQVLYELHLGTFTPEGTLQAAIDKLPYLAELGVTLVELMPVAEFAGEFGWGYDGVDLFAPSRLYGRPEDLRRFVDEAHALGLGVILDVVYNHLGPTGNYTGQFSDAYFTQKHRTDWGEAINFDGDHCQPVREFYLANAGYWIDEFHMDGLRLDAIHAIVDDSPEHILKAIRRRVREAAGDRGTLIFVENERQQSYVIRPIERGGYGLDAAWNDDFHHAARVFATGHSESYYSDYQGTPQELISALKWGFLYQGQWNARQERDRGTPGFDLSGPQFVTFLQNHDQVGNTPQGRRLQELTSPGRLRALTALWLLSPGTPMLFQGQEFAASSHFHYFADHEGELRRLVREGRRNEMRQFLRLAGHDVVDCLTDPCDRSTFEESKLDWSEGGRHREALDLHRDLLRLRREDPIFAAQRADLLHGSVVNAEALLLRLGELGGDSRLVIVNLGHDFEWTPAAEPLAAPPPGHHWQVIWSSEHPRYGGLGTYPFDFKRWYISGHAALVLGPKAIS